ncbi:LysM peptidoglycan-binding domain-containing protein [Xanthomonas oryzae]|uniref:LysM peptidoglycan-binding domain-containing protein n=1 Tax=Xanthomonas oryzae TaxID=347 RepID=UPI001F5E5D58|nr:LysM domain-containing protein [Xanthomonas oryzae]
MLKRQQLFYDDQGRVVRIVQTLPDNVTRLLETSHYDTAGRLLERRQYADDGSAKRIDASHYDADGRLTSQTAYGIPMGGVYQPVDEDGNPLPMPDDGLEGLQLLSVVNYQDGTPATGYDAAGRLRGYRYSLVRNEQGSGMTTPEGYTHTYRYTYQGAETYLTRQVVGTSTNRDFKTSNSTSTYDAWGKLVSVRETTPGGKVDDRLRYFTMDAEGNILRRTEGTIEGGTFTQDDAARLRTEQYAFANGQYVAAGRFDGKTDVLGQMNAYASTDVGTYKVTVQAGDTLRGLAQRLYGNSNLWYVLADANAIDDDRGLVAGATLNVPDIKANTNDATTFKPFNASEAVGSTTTSLPYIPKPPESGCGTLGMIIMVVVAIVVTIYTAGAAAGAMGAMTATGATAASAGTFAAGVGTLAGTYGATAAVVGGAAGAFAGSLASQGVGSAMGQTSFSWRDVAASTVAGAATAGFGTLVSGAPAVVAAVGTAAVGNVSSYVANKLVGNEASFSWKSVAASAVSAGITQQLAPTIARSIGVDATQYGQAITSGITGGIVSAHVRQGIVGGAVDYQDVFVDAFGNAVNGALMQRGSETLATQPTQAFSDEPTYLLASNGGGGGVGMGLPEEFWPLAAGNGDVRSNAIDVAGTQRAEVIPTMDTVYAVPDEYSPNGWYFYNWNPAGQQWSDTQRVGVGRQATGWSAPPAMSQNPGVASFIQETQQWNATHQTNYMGAVTAPTLSGPYSSATPQPDARGQILDYWRESALGQDPAGQLAIGVLDRYLHFPEMAGATLSAAWALRGTPDNYAKIGKGIYSYFEREGLDGALSDYRSGLDGARQSFFEATYGENREAAGRLMFDVTSMMVAPERLAVKNSPTVAQNIRIFETGGGNAEQIADELYNSIRASSVDVQNISASTGFKIENIQKVKDHVFNNEHVLDSYVDWGVPSRVGRFDSNLAQAEAWQRLENGTHTVQDVTWMKHEIGERWYEQKYNAGYLESHKRVEQRWPGNPWGAE